MQLRYLLTVILAITEFAPTNLVAGRPVLSSSPGTTPTQHHTPFQVQGAVTASVEISQAVTCAYKLGTNSLLLLLNALMGAGKGFLSQSGASSGIHGAAVSKVVQLAELMQHERDKIVSMMKQIAPFLSRTWAADSERLDIWPSYSVAHAADKIHHFVQLGELLGWGDIRKITLELDELKHVVSEKKIDGRMIDIVESMVVVAEQMLESQIEIVKIVHEVRVALNLEPVKGISRKGSLAGTIASSSSSRTGSSSSSSFWEG